MIQLRREIGTVNNIEGHTCVRFNCSLTSGFIPAISFNGTAGSFYIETRNQSYPDFYCSNYEIKSSTCENSFQRLNLNENWKLFLAISTSCKTTTLPKRFNYVKNLSVNHSDKTTPFYQIRVNVSTNSIYEIINIKNTSKHLYRKRLNSDPGPLVRVRSQGMRHYLSHLCMGPFNKIPRKKRILKI